MDAWRVNNRVNLLLLEHLDAEALEISSRPRARSVGDQFGHIHNARLLWLNVAAPTLAKGVEKIPKGAFGDIANLRDHLLLSSERMERVFEEGGAKGKIKGFKGSPDLFLGYMLAHEAHHRGQIILTLKLGGYKLGKEVEYGLWEWGKIQNSK